MALVFNPFTGNFDNVMASSSDMSFSGGSLNVNGDITLDSGGAFTTTVQAVTPTANRTISFPDQTGTVGLVSGATGNIQYNNAGALAATNDFNVDLNWTNSGVTYTGLKVNVTNTASASTSVALDVQANGASAFKVRPDGKLFSNNSNVYLFANDASTWSVSLDANAGLPRGSIRSASFQQPSDGRFAFTNSTNSNGAVDAALVRDSAGIIAVTDGSTGTGYLKQTPVLTSALPNAATVGAGTRGFVSDATTTTFGNPPTGGGSNNVPVYSDGSQWLIG